MRSTVLALVILMTGLGGACAQEIEYGADLLVFGTAQQPRLDSPYNPENLLAGLPRRQLETQARVRLRWESDVLVLSLGPRFGIRRDFGTNDASTDSSADYAYLQSWLIEARSERFDAFYSRELMLWGPSQFASPSNPFFDDTNQVNPFTELPSRDFIGARWRASDRTTVSLIRNISVGRDSEILRSFQPINALRVEQVEQNFTLGLNLAQREGSTQLGGYGQLTASDALLVYADAALFKGSRRLIARQPQGGNDWRLDSRDDADRLYQDAVIGASYTFEGGSTTNLEFRHNTEGYTAGELRDLGIFASEQATRFADPAPQISGSAAAQLGLLAQPSARSYGRSYVHLQYVDRKLVRDTSLVLQLSYGLDTSDGVATAVVSHDLNDRVRLSANLNVPFGSRDGEQRRYLNSVVFVGVTTTF
jgi:hypothetical protein